MEFRWVALIAVWTLIGGPILGGASTSSPFRPAKDAAKVVKPFKAQPARR